MVVDDKHYEARVAPAVPVLGYVDQGVDTEHLHRAVAHRGDDGPVRIGELRSQGVRDARTHRRERARERGLHPVPELELPSPPVRGGFGVSGEDAAVRQTRTELVVDPLGVEELRVLHRAVLQYLPPALDVLFYPLAPGAVLLTPEVRDQGSQGLLRITDEVDLHRVADADHLAVNVDLHASGLTRLRQPLRVREARADHEQRVAVLHHVVRGLGAEQAYRARYERQVVRERCPTVEGLRHPAPQDVGGLLHLLGSAERPGADQHGNLLTSVQYLGGAAQVLALRYHARGGGESDLGEDRAMSARRLLIVGLGHVVGHDDAGNRAGRLRDADGPVDEVGRLLRDHENLDELVRHVLVQRHQVDLLLIVAP